MSTTLVIMKILGCYTGRASSTYGINCFPTLLDMLYNMCILGRRNTHVKSLDMPIHLENHKIPPRPYYITPPPMNIMNKQAYLVPEPQFTIHLYIRIEHIGIGEYRRLLFKFVCTYIAEFSYLKLSYHFC